MDTSDPVAPALGGTRRRRRFARSAMVLLVGLLVAFVQVPARAEEPTPVPDATAGATSTPPTPSPTGPTSATPTSATPTSPTPTSPAPTSAAPTSTAPVTPPTLAPSSPSTTTADPGPRAGPSADPTAATPDPALQNSSPGSTSQSRSEASGISLVITPNGSPVAGQFFEDIGSYLLSGVLSPAAGGQPVNVYWFNTAAQKWIRSATVTTDTEGRYAATQPVGHSGVVTFMATARDPLDPAVVLSSPEVAVTVRDAVVQLTRPASSLDSLVDPILTGSVSPARSGVRVSLDLVVSGRWSPAVTVTTGADGRFRAVLGYGRGRLATYTVRASYVAANRARTEVSASYQITRSKVLNPMIRATTAADVAKTYRSGCPVGPSKLRTLSMNFYGYDGQMHRGVIIVRSDLTDDTVRGFDAALKAGFAIARMNNPNVYGGNDPKQMEANNTSGFNCRKVVGNPLRQSPHSYGIAVDVNTVQNPYRDASGKWWPSNGLKYRDRSPLKGGMLAQSSALTKQLKKDHYFWGGLWNPGRDYQHYEKR